MARILSRFSLRTLLLLVLLTGSGATLWWHWRAWDGPFTLDAGSGSLYHFEFSPDSSQLLTCTDTVRVWDVASRREMFRLLPYESRMVAHFSSDGRTLISSTNVDPAAETGEPGAEPPRCLIQRWDARSGAQLAAPIEKVEPDLQIMSRDDSYVLNDVQMIDAADAILHWHDNRCAVYDAASGKLRFSIGAVYTTGDILTVTVEEAAAKQALIKRAAEVTDLTGMPDDVQRVFKRGPVHEGRLLTQIIELGLVQKWDLKSGARLGQYELPALFPPEALKALGDDIRRRFDLVQFIDGRACGLVVLKTDPVYVQILDLASRQERSKYGPYHGRVPVRLFCERGWLISHVNSDTDRVRLWSLHQPELKHMIREDAAILCVFTDQTRAIVSSNSTTGIEDLSVWDLSTGQSIALLFAGANMHAPAVASPDGRNCCASGVLESLSIWTRRRPEAWWGLAWLPEFWLTILLSGLLIWSLRRPV